MTLIGTVNAQSNLSGAVTSGGSLSGQVAQTNSISGSVSGAQSLVGSLGSANTLQGIIANGGDLEGYITQNSEMIGAISGMGGSGTRDYNQLINKPQIEGVTLQGNKTYPELTLVALDNIDIYNVINGTNILGD